MLKTMMVVVVLKTGCGDGNAEDNLMLVLMKTDGGGRC